MTQKFTRLETAVLSVMRTNLEIFLSKGGAQNANAKRIDEAIRPTFHSIINKFVPCTQEELALTEKMLAHEGLLRMEFNANTGAEEGYSITKEGLVAFRSAHSNLPKKQTPFSAE